MLRVVTVDHGGTGALRDRWQKSVDREGAPRTAILEPREGSECDHAKIGG